MRSYRPVPVLGLLIIALFTLFTGCASSPERKPSMLNSVSTRIESRYGDFRECFGDTSIPDTIDEVRMKVRFWVDPTGTVTRSIVTESAVKDPILNECVLGVIQSIHFDRTSTETEVTYPLHISRNF